MSFWDELTGAASRRQIRAGQSNATNLLNTLLEDGTQIYNDAYTNQSGILEDAYDQAYGEVNAGYEAALDNTQTGFDAARNDLISAYNQAIGTQEDYLDRAQNILQPSMDRANVYNDMYANFLGANGAEAQTEALETYAGSNPLREYRDNLADRALRSQMNAAGVTGGRAAMALSRASLERGETDLQNYLNRIERQAGQGAQYASDFANMTYNTGGSIANYQANRGNQLASLEQNRTATTNNLTTDRGNRLGTLTSNHGTNQANLAGQNASNLVNLNSQVRNNQANIAMQGAAQVASNYGGQIGNMITGLGGALIAGSTPSASGTSAFGNMINGVRTLGIT